jgi:hypothetical protein
VKALHQDLPHVPRAKSRIARERGTAGTMHARGPTINKASNRPSSERVAFRKCLRTAKRDRGKVRALPEQAPGDMAMSDEQRATCEHYREIADKIRKVALQSDIPQIREELFDLADRVDQMAQAVENDGSRPAGQHLS